MNSPAPPEVGQLVRVRGQQWVVSEVSTSTLAEDELSTTRLSGRTLATLTSVSEDDLGEELSVVWEVEPGRFPGCTRVRTLHAHHVTYWSAGGATDLANLAK